MAAEPRVSRTPSKFLDRTAAIDELDDVLDAAASGRGSLALITGEPGIGRTSLALEMSHRAIARGFTAPLLLVIDDLQWADAGSIQLLAHVTTMLRHSPIALIATIRTGEPRSEGIARALAGLDRCAPIMLPIGGLPRTALADLAQANGLPPRAAAIDVLTTRTAGNPFFATELLRVPELSTDGAVSLDTLTTAVPSHLARAVRRRIALLDPVLLYG